MDTDDVYQYPRIAKPGEIRLFLLQPSPDFNSVIQCSLIYTTLNECEHDIINHYNAISYVWGDPSDRRTIYIDERPFNITTSLDCALRYIRDCRSVVRLWADGICIDQYSNEDRNSQVIQMGNIYSTAKHTIIFLGEGFPGMDFVFDVITEGHLFRFDQHLGDLALSQKSLNEFREMVETSILSEPWFRRIWVFQELVLSQSVWIQCGKRRVPWDSFCRSIITESYPSGANLRLLFNMWNTRLQHIRDYNTVFGGGRGTAAQKLLQIMTLRRGLGVSDPRDMVYAHLGMAGIPTEIQSITTKELDPSSLLRRIKVDYDQSFETVCLEITTYLMRMIPTSEILLHVEDQGLRIRSEGLPSWVPDWTIAWDYTYEIPNPDAERQRDMDNQARAFSEIPFYCKNSLVVPGVLAAVGTRRGVIKALISRPVICWDTKTSWSGQEIQLLHWMKHSTDQDVVQSTLETIVAYHNMIFALSHVQDLDVGRRRSYYPLWNSSGTEEKLWARFVSVANDVGYPTSFGELQQNDHDSIIRLLIHNTRFLMGAETVKAVPGTFQLALLDSGEYVAVSHLIRVGDIVCSFPGDRKCFVLRPRALSSLAIEQSNLIKTDFADSGAWKRHRAIVDIEHCDFIERCISLEPHPFNGLIGEPARPMIFAIH